MIIKSFIANALQNIENLNEEIRQETKSLAFLRRWEEDQEEAEILKKENAKKISDLESKISFYEKKLKSRDSLLEKMDEKLIGMKTENAAKISDLNSKISKLQDDLLLVNKRCQTISVVMNECQKLNDELIEKLKIAEEAHKQQILDLKKQNEELIMQRDENRTLFDFMRYCFANP